MDEPVTLIKTEEEPETVLDALRKKREALAENKSTFIAVPGYDKSPPVLMVQYRLLNGNEFDAIANRVTKQFRDRWERTLYAAIDTMIAACSGIYIDMGHGETPQPLTFDHGQIIRGFDTDLAQALGFVERLDQTRTARSVVLALFGGNEVMISAHNMQLSRWMSDTSVDVTDDFLGNY